jgi:hypothetical protein
MTGRIALGCLALLVLSSIGRAEIFVLTNSGEIRGELLNKDESPRKTYVVRTASGAEVTLEKSQVAQVRTQNAAQLEYEKIAPKYPDTVDGQWQLAQWCQEHRLTAERKVHLQRVVELNPDHKEARGALGYSFINGAWVMPDQLMQEKGYVRYKGKWVLPQEVELLEQQRKDELAEKEWFQKMKRLHDELVGRDPNRADRALETLRDIKDPYAVIALADYLDRERDRQIREWYINALGNIATNGAYHVIAVHAIEDADVEIRLACLEQVEGKKLPEVVAYFLGGLQSKDNVRVNRCGIALGRMKDPATIPALVDGLVTTHKFQVITGPPPGATSATFDKTGGSSGGGGLSVGGSPPKIISQQMRNRDVHDALTLITGVDFDYDVALWQHWLAAQKKNDTLGVRRDGN